MYTFTLADLKERLVSAKDFGEVWNFFLDHFGNSSDFMMQGERARHPVVEAVLDQVTRQILHQSVDFEHFMLKQLADDGFVHGSGMVGGAVVGVLYFEDVDAGMAVCCKLGGPSHFARFSLKKLRGVPEPSRN